MADRSGPRCHRGHRAVGGRLFLDPVLPEFGLVGGAFAGDWLDRYGSEPGCLVAGRPVRDVAGAQRRTERVSTGDDGLDHWLQSAQDELDAVVAFVQLAYDLAALGASAVLVRRAVSAANDELSHALMCAQVLAACGHPARWRSSAPIPQGPRRVSRAQLAAESLADGCVNEGAAALLAGLGARRASGLVAATLARIAREEAGHAALAWDVVRWATGLRTLTPPPVGRAIGLGFGRLGEPLAGTGHVVGEMFAEATRAAVEQAGV